MICVSSGKEKKDDWEDINKEKQPSGKLKKKKVPQETQTLYKYGLIYHRDEVVSNQMRCAWSEDAGSH